MFILKCVFIVLVLVANFKAEILSSRDEECGVHVTNKEVLKFPHNDSYSILVNLESL